MAENPRREAGNNKANEIAVARENLRSTAETSKVCVVDGSGLIVHAKADVCEHDRDDLDATAEFPVLVVDEALYASEENEEAEEEAGLKPVRQQSPEERAAFSLQHLEPDIQCLQAKWESAAADLRIREARVEKLCGKVEASDLLVRDLRRQIGEQAQLALKTDLNDAVAQIADLVAARIAREISMAVAQARSDLQKTWEVIATAEANRATSEKARLSDTVDRHAETTASARRRYVDQTTRDLRARIEELETYINDSTEHWSALCAKVAEYRDAHCFSERRVADVQARFVAETMSCERLWNEAAHLGRRLEKLRAQLAERKRKHREVKHRLKEERAAAKQLRADVARATACGSQALDELKERERRVAQLDLLVRARDETIAGLEQRLRARDRTESELIAKKNDVEGHFAALELEVRLAVESGARKERDYRIAEQRFEGLLREAGHEIDNLVTVIEEHERTISSLEGDVRARQNAVGILERMLERSARRRTAQT